MSRPFLIWPDRRLTMVAAPVPGIDDTIRALWDEMLAAMYAMPGIGLAAPQIGVPKRVCVVDCSETKDQPLRMANPEILHASVEFRDHEEASPNLPGLFATVSRPRAVTVRYLDEVGEIVERDFVRLWAVSVQHQIDHLNGRMFFDHLKPVKRKMLLAKHAKRRRRAS